MIYEEHKCVAMPSPFSVSRRGCVREADELSAVRAQGRGRLPLRDVRDALLLASPRSPSCLSQGPSSTLFLPPRPFLFLSLSPRLSSPSSRILFPLLAPLRNHNLTHFCRSLTDLGSLARTQLLGREHVRLGVRGAVERHRLAARRRHPLLGLLCARASPSPLALVPTVAPLYLEYPLFALPSLCLLSPLL